MTQTARTWLSSITWRQWGLLVLCLLADSAIFFAVWSLAGSPDGISLAFNNTLVTPTWVMKEGLFRLNNSLRFGRSGMNRSYDKQFRVDGAKVGYVVNARLPVEYLVRDGAEFQGQDVQERIVPIAITDQNHVAIEFGSSSLTMEVDDYRERYLEPAFDILAATLDKRAMQRMAQDTSEWTGTPAVPPGSTGTLPYAATDAYLDAGVILDEAAVPVDDRKAFLPPKFHRYLVGGQQTLFHPSAHISSTYRRGQFGNDALGVDEWYKTQSTYRHTIGPLGGTPLVNGAGQSGSSIITDGWTAAAANRLKKGDKIAFASSNAVNPQTKQSTSTLKGFTVTQDIASDGAGAATITISPAIYGPGSSYQNVTALPANDDAITIFGHASSHANKVTQMGIINNKNAYALVSADLELMRGAWVCERIRSK